MLELGEPKPRRRPSLTPMIDVVFLLLVFFMPAARFGLDHAIMLQSGGGSGAYSGPPRLVEATPDGLLLNGIMLEDATLLEALAPLTTSSEDIVILRGTDLTDTQRIVDLLTLLNNGGFSNVALVE